MTIWTPATQHTETWASEAPAIRIFSPAIFSHVFVGLQRVFALGSQAGVWDEKAQQAEVWTPE